MSSSTEPAANQPAPSILEETVRKAFDYGLRGETAGLYSALSECVDAFGAEATTAMCRVIDPDRFVLDHPLRPDELGLLGWYPYAENTYHLCSSIYGDHISGYEGDESFLDACIAGYDNGQLHDCGHIVVDLGTRQPGVLLTRRLEKDTVPDSADLASLRATYGLDFRILAWPAVPGSYRDDAYLALTCLLSETSRFPQAYDITCDMTALITKWAMGVKKAPV